MKSFIKLITFDPNIVIPSVVKAAYYSIVMSSMVVSLLCVLEGLADQYGIVLFIIGLLTLVGFPIGTKLLIEILFRSNKLKKNLS